MKRKILQAMRNLSLALLVIAVIFGCSKGDVVRVARIAATGDVASAQRMAAEKAARYAAVSPKTLARDIERFQDGFAKLVDTFRKAVGSVWGREEVKEPKPKEYVKYTQNYLSCASVDFDSVGCNHR